MITKRNGNGQTICKGCKDKGKFDLNWDSSLYNFNDEPYCFHCLMEKLEEYQLIIDKSIEILEKKPYLNKIEEVLEILKGSDKND